jgi:hypothetical protein
MPGSLQVDLNPARITMDASGEPVELLVVVRNLGDVVDQYSVEISGLDSDWFAPPPSIGLFPQDTETVRINLHPPRAALRKGNYPFRVLVRSRGGAAEESAEGMLEIGGAARLRLDVTPRQHTAHRYGTFKVQVANSGNADVQVVLDGRDAEETCDVRFPGDNTLLVPADSAATTTVRVRPRKRPWVGAEHTFNFAVTARPQSVGPEPQTAPAQFTHKPWLRSWAPLRTVAFVVVGLAIVLVVLSVLVSVDVPEKFPGRFQVALAVLRGSACGVPALAGICPPDALAAVPEIDEHCSYSPPFQDYVDADSTLIGACRSRVGYDGFGNGMQFSANGVLFWQKNSDTVYFLNTDSAYALLQQKSQLLHRASP